MGKKTTEMHPVDWFLKKSGAGRTLRVAFKKQAKPLLPSFWQHSSQSTDENLGRLWHKIPGFHTRLSELVRFVRSLDQELAALSPSSQGRITEWTLLKAESTQPTPNCVGYAKEVLLQLGLEGYFASGAKIVAYGPGAETEFRRDGYEPLQPRTYHLHIPITTSATTKFEWKMGSESKQVHFGANGQAYLINVSETHRIVNRSKRSTSYHFVCALNP